MYIRKATEIDVYYFAHQLAKGDIEEYKASHGTTKGINDTLMGHLSDTSVVLTNSVGEVLAYGGNQGDCVWFLTSSMTERLNRKNKMEFRNLIMEYRDQMLSQYPVLWNYVWVGNESHKRFLRSIGAVFHDKFTESPTTGEKFQLFTIN